MFLNIRPYYLIMFVFVSLSFYSCGSDDDTITPPEPILGCTDPEGNNYNSNATEDDGSCEYDPILGCTDPESNNYDPNATEDDGSCDYGPLLDWVKTYGGSDEDTAISIVKTNDGGFMVLSSTRSTDGDITGKTTTDLDYWLLKLNSDGDKIWDKTYGGSLDDIATDLANTNDGGYIISGYTASTDGDVSENAGSFDYWIVKVDGSGTIAWEKSWGFEGNDRAFGVIQTSDGGYFATGFLDVGFVEGDEGNDLTDDQGTRATQHSLGDYWGIKMDADGNKIWRRYFGGSHIDQSKDIIETADGGFLLIGISESSDFDISNARGANDFWIVKVNAEGDMLWEKSLGGSESDFAYSITNTTDGNFIITGDTRSSDFDISSFKGNADVWVVKFNNANGSIIWEKTYGGTNFDSSRGITKLDNGKYLISGNSSSSNLDVASNNGSNDAWSFIIDEDGNLEFETNVGGSNIDFAIDAVETLDHKIIVVGYTGSNNVDITLNKGGNDLLIYKLK